MEVIILYTKDKQTRVTLRLNPNQFDFVKSNADILGVSPSEFLRMVINAAMSSVKVTYDNKKIENLDSALMSGKEGFGRANDKTSGDNLI